MSPPNLFQPSTTTPGRRSIIPSGSFGPSTTTDPSPFGTSIGPDPTPPATGGGFDPSSGIVPSTNNGGNQITVFAPPTGGSNTLPMPIPTTDPTTVPIAPAAVVGLSPLGKLAIAVLGITGGVLLFNLAQRHKQAA